MTYTFDDAVVRVSELSKKGADAWFGDQLDERKTIKGHIEEADVEAIIYKLRQEYAPMVEMTSGEKATILDEKEGISLSWVLTDSRSFDAMYWGNRSERDIAQAWLHPETIKVVDE